MTRPASDFPTAKPTEEPVSSAEAAPSPGFRPPRSALTNSIIQVGVILISVTVTAIFIRILARGRPAYDSWPLQVLLGLGTVAGILWGAWQRYKLWTLPVRTLGTVVEKVRRGELPIEELSKVGGVPSVLVPVLRDLLADLRRQRQELTQLNQEMNQRVANRTDALERMLGTLREKASRDMMTGLYNRRMLDETLPRLIEARIAEPRHLTVLMIDVDYFKLLNDTLGHGAGDELLRSIGQIIRSTIRGTDYGFRSGGDEFVILLEDADAAAGRALGDRLISLVDGLAKTLRVTPKPRLSIGVSQLSDIPSHSAAGLLEAADKALYEIKRGRKRSNGALKLPIDTSREHAGV